MVLNFAGSELHARCTPPAARKFSWLRQQVIDGFIADFYCAKLRIVVEIDGGVHEQQKDYDRLRDEILQRRQLRVLRFSNEEVISDIHGVLDKIASFGPSPASGRPSPSPSSGEGYSKQNCLPPPRPGEGEVDALRREGPRRNDV